ncbi:MAG TPA: NAD(P)/FAD-dependent oxidoreductase [Solirubrobacteraceae bacterium]|jgi:cation diffusion facilitator CzcD-associated flavoprotein CzcO|nr:NAD(P)/FAD-dependent oxidoreductase [Solirubrobacteraceae bacterium]
MTAELSQTNPSYVDVLIVGAGVSGIGAAYHLQDKVPGRTYAILEGREAIGGTWDLFRYPGIRSDSDLHTFGYAFKPWTSDKAIADGPEIREYIEETATENGIDRHIRFGHRVRRARWSSEQALWTVEGELAASGEPFEIAARWLFCACGYYRYDEGFTPHFEGIESFQGQVIHPQHWPEDLDYADKRVVVIGSGATAVTLIPAMAKTAAHVTMLQRSPTYILSIPSEDPIANGLRRILPDRTAYAITRRKNIFLQSRIYSLCQRYPKAMRRIIRKLNAVQLPESCPVDVHFNPKYDPWDQRLCIVPDSDLYRSLRAGTSSVVTDEIETFTEHGVRLRSGAELEADIIITATGLNLLAFGGVELAVDGEPVNMPDKIAYKGAMLSGIPNFSYALGYTNASWTLKVDLVCEYVCRLLAHMDAHGRDACVAEPADPNMGTRPLLDFKAGYVQRALDQLPKQGAQEPWTVAMKYDFDIERLRKGAVDDGTLRFFDRAPAPAPELVGAA